MRFFPCIPFFHLYPTNMTQDHPFNLFILSNLRLEESRDSSEWNSPFLFHEFLFHEFMLPD